MRAPWRHTAWLTASALLVRGAVVGWAAGRFPPADDGAYYHQLATRLAGGQGYTWAWPDGAVTAAAHYPVGYPAALAGLYAALGPEPVLGMLLNAALGSLAVLAVHRLLAGHGARVAGCGAAAVALHPGLVFYTPALMTEAVVGSLWCVAAWCVAAARVGGRRRRLGALVGAGLTLGLCTLVRPQSLLLAPLFGLLAARSNAAWPRRVAHAAVATALALAVCLPWTMRNCRQMGRCALVSVNGGWNLLIGTDLEAGGAWAPLKVPPGCREVYDEAQKDLCFQHAAVERIRTHPGAWLSLVPAKLSVTFDYCGAPGWYLHSSNARSFGEQAKVVLGVVETMYERVVLVLCLLAARPRRRGWARRGWGRLRSALALLGVCLTLTKWAWVSVLCLVAVLVRWRRSAGPPVRELAAAAVGTTALAHAVFFGAGRYALPMFPLLCALGALGAARWLGPRGRSPAHRLRGIR